MAKLKKFKQEFEYEAGDEVYKYSPLTSHDLHRSVDPSKPNIIHKVLNKIEGDIQYQIIYLVEDEKNPYNAYEFNPTAATIEKAKQKEALKQAENKAKFEETKAKVINKKPMDNISTTNKSNLINKLKFDMK